MEFVFPIPPGYDQNPVWIGNEFQIGSEKTNVLKYTQCDSGWDASLTDFHEQEVDAGNYYIDRISRLHATREIEKYIKKSEAIILEIGTSSGYLIQDIKKLFPENFLIGSDCIPEPLENIAKKKIGVPLIQFDLVKCPLPNACVDVVIALNVLEHIQDDKEALQQIYRILKPGGYVIIEVPANQDLFDFFDEQLKHFRRYNSKALCEMAAACNFDIVDISHLAILIYPAFKYVKLRNKRKKTAEYNKNDVKDMIRMGGFFNDHILYRVMLFELYLGKFIKYPFGIRCLLTLKKPLEKIVY